MMTSAANPPKSGIYGIHCRANGKWYVGQAKNIRRRNQEERRSLSRGTCHNTHLQHAWDKYGAQSFTWVVLFNCPVSELDHWEKVWVARLDSFANGFNKTRGGCGARGYKHSPEWREKASERNRDGRSPRKGRPISAEAKDRMRANALGGNSPKARPVVQLTKAGEVLAHFPSIADAERATGVLHISAVCNRHEKRKSAGGFLWVWEAEHEGQ